MNSKTTFLIFFLFITANINSQVLNIDRETDEDTVFKKWVRVADLSLSSDKLKQNLLDLSAKIEFDRFFKNGYVLVSSASNELYANGPDVLQNEGYIQFRYRDDDQRVWSDESYIQYQWNDALGMEYRKVLGSNLRRQIFDREHIDLYTGLGVFVEDERWNWSAVEAQNMILGATPRYRKLARLNHYWKFAHKINDILDITTISYFQFPLNEHFFNPRWYWDLNANIKIDKKISFVIHWDNTFDNYRLVPILTYYYSINFGFRAKW